MLKIRCTWRTEQLCIVFKTILPRFRDADIAVILKRMQTFKISHQSVV